MNHVLGFEGVGTVFILAWLIYILLIIVPLKIA